MTTFIAVVLYFIFLFLSLHACGIYRKTDARTIPTDGLEKARKNIEEGRTIKFGNINNRSGEFDFASSNEMWRASIEMLDFIPLSSADYGGGMIITDWYNDGSVTNESIKIVVKFLSNEIRADGIKVTVFKKKCNLNTDPSSCMTSENENLADEIKVAILKKASMIKILFSKLPVPRFNKW